MIKILSFTLLSSCLFSTSVFAIGSIQKQFLEHYPQARGTKLESCSTCHSPALAKNEFLNAYAIDLKKVNMKYDDVKDIDSDKDGVSNIDEINLGSFPGSHSQAVKGTEIFIFTNKNGDVPFDHGKHATLKKYRSKNPINNMKGQCFFCHEKAMIPKEFNDNISMQEAAHKKACFLCHKNSESENAPKTCRNCHSLFPGK